MGCLKLTYREHESPLKVIYRKGQLKEKSVQRCLSTDPLAADYMSISPYVYVGDNPILFVDPDGKKIIPSAQFTSSKYGKIHSYLMANNATYSKLLSGYQNNDNFNLYLKVDPNQYAPITQVRNTQYQNGKNGVEAVSFTTTAWDFYSMIHESIHEKEPFVYESYQKNGNSDHEGFTDFFDKAIKSFTELSQNLELNWTTNQIKEVSFWGAEGSSLFTKYISDLASKNGTTVAEETKSYETRVQDLLKKEVKIPENK